MKINFIRNSYIRFYQSHKKEIDKAISRCLCQGSLIMESEVEKFEKNFAKFCGRKYCITVASGTDALVLASVIGKLNPISDYRYRLPKYILDKNSDIALVTYMNSVVTPVKGKYKMIVEDSCQGVGRKLIGDISCFSFYPAKMIGGLGKGGALVLNDKKIYEKLKAIRDDKWNNIWLDEVSAAFLNIKLKYLPTLLKKRQKIADYYNKHLPQSIIFNKNCLQNYLVIVEKRAEPDEFIKYMRKHDIEVFSDESDFYEGNLKNAIRIPIYPELKSSEVKFITKTINSFYE